MGYVLLLYIVFLVTSFLAYTLSLPLGICILCGFICMGICIGICVISINIKYRQERRL